MKVHGLEGHVPASPGILFCPFRGPARKRGFPGDCGGLPYNHQSAGGCKCGQLIAQEEAHGTKDKPTKSHTLDVSLCEHSEWDK